MGFFKEAAGNGQCVSQCPENMTSSFGSTSQSQCYCRNGFQGLRKELLNFEVFNECIVDVSLGESFQRQEEIDRANKEAAVAARVARGESLSDIGKDMYTGSGQAFEAGRTDAGGGFTGGKTVDSPSTPGGKYSSPRKDGGLMYADGGRVYLYNRLK